MKYGSEQNDSAVLALQRTTHATLRLLAMELTDLGLTASELNLLANAADGRARTVSELGAAVGSRASTLTGVLDRLENRGLVTRGPSPADRRAIVVSLTAAGRRTAARIRKSIASLERHALAGLPREAVAGFHAVLTKLTEAST